jgi:hypothetical protein
MNAGTSSPYFTSRSQLQWKRFSSRKQSCFERWPQVLYRSALQPTICVFVGFSRDSFGLAAKNIEPDNVLLILVVTSSPQRLKFTSRTFPRPGRVLCRHNAQSRPLMLLAAREPDRTGNPRVPGERSGGRIILVRIPEAAAIGTVQGHAGVIAPTTSRVAL